MKGLDQHIQDPAHFSNNPQRECDSTMKNNDYVYTCEKRKGHKGYHKSGFHAW